MTTLNQCKLLGLPQAPRSQGNLTAIEGMGDIIPFEIERVFYLYDVIGGAARGGHAHHQLEQFIVGAMGAFHVVIDDGSSRRVVELNRAYMGLYVPPLIWTELIDFSAGAICIALVSTPFDEADYIRDYEEFVAVKRDRGMPTAPGMPAGDSQSPAAALRRSAPDRGEG